MLVRGRFGAICRGYPWAWAKASGFLSHCFSSAISDFPVCGEVEERILSVGYLYAVVIALLGDELIKQLNPERLHEESNRVAAVGRIMFFELPERD